MGCGNIPVSKHALFVGYAGVVRRAALSRAPMTHRIPRTIRLPFGYTVKVREVSKREMEDECGDYLDGCWMVEDRTIYLRASLNVTRKRYILCHELQHAVADLQHQALNEGTGKP